MINDIMDKYDNGINIKKVFKLKIIFLYVVNIWSNRQASKTRAILSPLCTVLYGTCTIIYYFCS